MFYRVIFKRDFMNNPLTGSAQYRVVGCYPTRLNRAKIQNFSHKTDRERIEKKWGILLNNPRQIGTIINPKSALFH